MTTPPNPPEDQGGWSDGGYNPPSSGGGYGEQPPGGYGPPPPSGGGYGPPPGGGYPPPPPGGSGYGAPPPGYGPPSSGGNGPIIMGIIGIVCWFCCPPASIALGLIGQSQAKKSGQSVTLSVVAWIGGVVFSILWIAYWIYVIFTVDAGSSRNL